MTLELRPPPLTLCLSCGARRPGIGGSSCLRCGSMALQLRAGHVLVETGRGWQCAVCGGYPSPRPGVPAWGVDGFFGEAAELPDCETVSAGFEESDAR